MGIQLLDDDESVEIYDASRWRAPARLCCGYWANGWFTAAVVVQILVALGFLGLLIASFTLQSRAGSPIRRRAIGLLRAALSLRVIFDIIDLTDKGLQTRRLLVTARYQGLYITTTIIGAIPGVLLVVIIYTIVDQVLVRKREMDPRARQRRTNHRVIIGFLVLVTLIAVILHVVILVQSVTMYFPNGDLLQAFRAFSAATFFLTFLISIEVLVRVIMSSSRAQQQQQQQQPIAKPSKSLIYLVAPFFFLTYLILTVLVIVYDLAEHRRHPEAAIVLAFLAWPLDFIVYVGIVNILRDRDALGSSVPMVTTIE